MCDIGTVFGILSSVVGFISDSQEAKNQQAFNDRQEAITRQNAIANAKNQTDTENTAQQERESRDSQDIAKVRKEALQARARARTAAGEAGVAGISVDALQRQFAGEEAQFVTDTRTNAQFARAQGANRRDSFKLGAQNRINASIHAPVKRPSFFGAALRIGGTAFSGLKKAGVFDSDGGINSVGTFTTRRSRS